MLQMKQEGRGEDHFVLDWLEESSGLRADLTDPLGRTLLYLTYESGKAAQWQGPFAASLFAHLKVRPNGQLQWNGYDIGLSLPEWAAFLGGRLPHSWLSRTIWHAAGKEYGMVKVQDGMREIIVHFPSSREGVVKVDLRWSLWWGLRSQQLHIELDQKTGQLHSSDGSEIHWTSFSS